MKKHLLTLGFLLLSIISYSQSITGIQIFSDLNTSILKPANTGWAIIKTTSEIVDFKINFDDISKVTTGVSILENPLLFNIIQQPFKSELGYKFKLQFLSNTKKIDLLFSYNGITENFVLNVLNLPAVQTVSQTSYRIFSGGTENDIVLSNITNIENIDIVYGQTFQSTKQNDGSVVQGLSYKYDVYKQSNKLIFRIKSTIVNNFTSIPLFVKLSNCDQTIPLINVDLNCENPSSNLISFDNKSLFYKSNLPQTDFVIIPDNIWNSAYAGRTIGDLLVENTEYLLKNDKTETIATFFLKNIIGFTNRKLVFEIQTIKSFSGIAAIWNNQQRILLTDFEIKPNPQIDKIEIFRTNNWTTNLTIYPNEKFLLKLQGDNLNNSSLSLGTTSIDSKPQISNTNNVAIFEINVKKDIQESEINILINGGVIGLFKLNEYQIPSPLNYLTSINSGLIDISTQDYIYSSKKFADLNGQLILNLDPNYIESKNLYGVQYLILEVKVLDNEKNLVSEPIVKKYLIKPTGSIRSNYYNNTKSAFHDELNMNSINILNLLPSDPKLNDLNEYKSWETIEITIKTDETVYKEIGYQKKIVLINKSFVVVKPSLTLPTGLFVYREGGLSNATGISATALYQMQFYNKNQRKLPCNLGLGIIGLDAINFISNKDSTDTKGTQDLGIVGLLTIDNFVNPDRKSNISFTIHVGGGYLLNNKKWFWLIGPGITFNLSK